MPFVADTRSCKQLIASPVEGSTSLTFLPAGQPFYLLTVCHQDSIDVTVIHVGEYRVTCYTGTAKWPGVGPTQHAWLDKAAEVLVDPLSNADGFKVHGLAAHISKSGDEEPLQLRWSWRDGPKLARVAKVGLQETPDGMQRLREALKLLCTSYGRFKEAVARMTSSNVQLQKDAEDRRQALAEHSQQRKRREEELYIKFSLVLRSKKDMLVDLRDRVTELEDEVTRLRAMQRDYIAYDNVVTDVESDEDELAMAGTPTPATHPAHRAEEAGTSAEAATATAGSETATGLSPGAAGRIRKSPKVGKESQQVAGLGARGQGDEDNDSGKAGAGAQAGTSPRLVHLQQGQQPWTGPWVDQLQRQQEATALAAEPLGTPADSQPIGLLRAVPPLPPSQQQQQPALLRPLQLQLQHGPLSTSTQALDAAAEQMEGLEGSTAGGSLAGRLPSPLGGLSRMLGSSILPDTQSPPWSTAAAAPPGLDDGTLPLPSQDIRAALTSQLQPPPQQPLPSPSQPLDTSLHNSTAMRANEAAVATQGTSAPAPVTASGPNEVLPPPIHSSSLPSSAVPSLQLHAALQPSSHVLDAETQLAGAAAPAANLQSGANSVGARACMQGMANDAGGAAAAAGAASSSAAQPSVVQVPAVAGQSMQALGLGAGFGMGGLADMDVDEEEVPAVVVPPKAGKRLGGSRNRR